MAEIMKVEGQEYILTDQHQKHMKENKIKKPYLRMRIRSGWSLDLAVQVPRGVGRNQAKAYVKFKKLDGEKSLAKKHYLKPKPWLKKYPQKTKFGDYAQQLFKECCGSW